MERVLAAGIFAMAISILAGPKFIDFMRRKEFGQHIREEGPADHHVKQGTPTMGGLLIIVSMKSRTRSRRPASIGSNQSSKR